MSFLHIDRTAIGRVRLDQHLTPGGLVVDLMRSCCVWVDGCHVLQADDAAVWQADRQLLQRHESPHGARRRDAAKRQRNADRPRLR